MNFTFAAGDAVFCIFFVLRSFPSVESRFRFFSFLSDMYYSSERKKLHEFFVIWVRLVGVFGVNDVCWRVELLRKSLHGTTR
jgi:hypothetical protein